MLRFEESHNPVSQQDAEVLVGVIATVTGGVLGGDLDADMVETFAQRFVNAGLLEPEPDGSMPSAGTVALALENLVQRLRYACEDHNDRPSPLPRLIAHVLELPTRDAALDCQQALPGGQVRDSTIGREASDVWVLSVFYPELPPDPDFREREQTLRQAVERVGGRYSGSQRPSR